MTCHAVICCIGDWIWIELEDIELMIDEFFDDSLN